MKAALVVLLLLIRSSVLKSSRPAATHHSQWKPIPNPNPNPRLPPPHLLLYEQHKPTERPVKVVELLEEKMDKMLKSFQDKVDRMLDVMIKTKVETEISKAVQKMKLEAEGSGVPLVSSSISESGPLGKETGYHGHLTRDIAPDPSTKITHNHHAESGTNTTLITNNYKIKRDNGNARPAIRALEPTLKTKTAKTNQDDVNNINLFQFALSPSKDAVDLKNKIFVVDELPKNETVKNYSTRTNVQPSKNSVDLSTKIFVTGKENITGEESTKSKRTAYYYPKPDLIPNIKIPNLGHNTLEHAPPDPFVALFLSHYGKYLPRDRLHSGYDRFRNIYSYSAANNIHNNMPFGSYKIYEDNDK